MTTSTLSATLSKFAAETSADMGEDLAAAVKAMRDEPTEVAANVGCTVDEVVAWCAEQRA